MPYNPKKISIAVFVLVLAAVLIWAVKNPIFKTQQKTNLPDKLGEQVVTGSQSPGSLVLPVMAFPISNALDRITKKPFGLFITPSTSPVQPERFKGYHTGVDFETTPAEQKIDVPISAVCEGKLLVKKWAAGYGGVAVQSCTLNNQPITVVYGHLRLSSITAKIGNTVQVGDRIAVLGTGYSSETDNERKHLHLGVHKGAGVNILGYVQKQGQLAGWIDAKTLLAASSK